MKKLTTTIKSLLLSSLIASGVGVYADDTEVFYSENVSKPNLLFVLDLSDSMNTVIEGSTSNSQTQTIRLPDGQSDSFQTIRFDDDGELLSSDRDSGNAILTFDRGMVSRFRFINVDVPKNANILEAYIQFTSADNDTNFGNGRARFRLSADNVPDAPQNADFTSDEIMTSGAVWEPGNWGDGERTENTRAGDGMLGLVQTLVNKDGWESGNAMAFYVSATSDSNRDRKAAAFEDPNRGAAELVIRYGEEDDGLTRLEALQQSLRAVLADAPDNVQVGMMSYGQYNNSTGARRNFEERHRHHSVSGIHFPITDINFRANTIVGSEEERFGLPLPNDIITVREYIADIVDGFEAQASTPIVDALYEAALYYRGEKVHYGQRSTLSGGAHPSTHKGDPITLNVSDTNGPGRDNDTAPLYKTPIESSCQSNNIVLMTDGAPTYLYRQFPNNGQADDNAVRGAGPLARFSGQPQGPQGALASAITNCETAAGVGETGDCGAELTHYIANNDNLPSLSNARPDGQDGDQTINTYTIGFGIDENSITETYLKSLATADDGNENTVDDGYFGASTPAELAAAFAAILEAVSEPSGTLASPGYSVNVRSGLEHERDIYIPVFDRRNTSRWNGNLKKFRIVDEGDLRQIRGSNNRNAVNELGSFTDEALDYWSSSPASSPDGGNVEDGGLANLLNPPERNIFSDIVSNNLSADAENSLVVDNDSITNTVLGLSDESTQADRQILINFMRGWERGDATSNEREIRYHMGDMLHSEPLVVTYDDGESSGTSGATKQFIFAGTNEGYIHAFDTSDVGPNAGKEQFAFIPSELLSTISEPQFLNAGDEDDHAYGVDGSLTFRFIDIDGDGIVDPADDQVILYFGMRRGGSSFYALDVTEITRPKLLWKVTKSEDQSNPLSRLGQSWSAPYLARVGVDEESSTCVLTNGQTKNYCKEVMIVSGGYDPVEDRNQPGTLLVDDATSVVSTNVGDDIFIFDIEDGSLVWSLPASEKAKLTSSTPGGARILDTNSNDVIDRMYFGDTGGNLWRLDLSERISTSDTESKLTKLADLANAGNQSRKFFNEPDVSSLRLNGRTRFLVSIGSGYRAHPLDETIDDKFFMIVDESPFAPIEGDNINLFTSITQGELAQINVTENSISQTGSIRSSKGWMVNLANGGEKVLATSVTVDGVVLFTTLVPETLTQGAGIDVCAAPVTQGRLYAIDILSGNVADDPLSFNVAANSVGSGPDNGSGAVDGLGADDVPVVGGGGAFTTVSAGEIPGKPQAIFNGLDVNDDTGVCRHPVDIRIGKKLSQATGYEACRLESIYWGDPETETN